MFLFPILWPGECTKVGTCIFLIVAFVLAISLLLRLQLSLLFSLLWLTRSRCFSAVCLLFSRCWERRIFCSGFERGSPLVLLVLLLWLLLSCLQGRQSNLGLLVYFLRCCFPPLLTRYALIYLLLLSKFQFWLLQLKEFLLFFQCLALFFCLFSYPFPAEMIFR